MTGLGGLPLPKRPDQQRNYPPSGVQPGSASGIIRAREVIISGTSAGILVYNPSPGVNNLVASMSAGITADSYGNPVLDFEWAVYNFASGIAAGLQANSIQTFKLSGGHWVGSNDDISFGQLSGIIGILAAARIQEMAPQTLITASVSPTPITTDLLEVQGSIATSSGIALIVSSAAEVVHQFTSGFPAGWTGTVSYWLLSDGVSSRVSMDFHLTIANGTVVTNNEDLLNAVGASYHFSDNKFVFGQINGGGLAGNQFAPMRISSTGELFYGGPAFTAAGNAFFYGGSTYSVAV